MVLAARGGCPITPVNPLGMHTPLPSESAHARAVAERRSVHVPDTSAPPQGIHASWATRMAAQGVRTFLAIPALLEDRVAGLIVLRRAQARAFSPQEVAAAESFASQAAIVIENTRLFTELQARDDRRRQELERASAIQQRLLPSFVEGWPGVLEIADRFRPAVETSGDFYGVFRLAAPEEGALAPLQIAVGDVAGKGMSAALVTALARSALRFTASLPTAMVTPANTLRLAGQRLHADVGAQHFVACALAVVEPPGLHHAGPRLRLANAAQVPVLLVRGGRAQELEPSGYRLPLGSQADGDYKDVEMDLAPADVVVCSSDGLVEAPAQPQTTIAGHFPPPEQAGELFGFERFSRSAAHWSVRADSAEGIAASLWSDLTAWCGDKSHHDDMTLLVLRVARW